MDWTQDDNIFLEKLRLNSVFLYGRHAGNYNEYKSTSRFFDVPIIVVSAFSASFGVGTQNYISQNVISGVSCGVSIIVTILTAIKLYLGLDQLIQNELELSKEFNLLALQLFKQLETPIEKRTEEPHDYITDTFTRYTQLISKSSVLRTKLPVDLLMPITMNKLNEEPI